MTYEYLPEEDIYVIQAELPESVKGFCKEVEAYKYAIINENLEDDEKLKTAEHEIQHLINGDLYKDFDELKVK